MEKTANDHVGSDSSLVASGAVMSAVRVLIGLIVVMVAPLSSAGGVSAILLPGTVQDHYGNPSEEDALLPENVFAALDPIKVGAGSRKEGENMIPVTDQGVFTNFGDYYSYSYPVSFDAPMPKQKIVLNSYLVKPNKKIKYILYPIATAFDEGGTSLETLFPTDESTIKGNVISNVVVLSEGTKFLLLHTHPKFVTLDTATGDKRSSDEVLAGIASLGGVIGGVFSGVLFNSQVKRGKVAIAPVGIAEVMQYKR